jgi:tRNA(Leu) C34 or U34 (ribose-2'-O)-methylase TrmL
MITKLHLAAYQTDLAHNLGSMIRLAACFGVVLGYSWALWFSAFSKEFERSFIGLR